MGGDGLHRRRLATVEPCRGGHVERRCNFLKATRAVTLAVARNIDSLPLCQPTRSVARMAEPWVLLCRLLSTNPKL